MHNLHWRYFLALEADFAETSRYVEFSELNFDTHSIEFLRLLLAAGAECDVLLRTLSAKYAPLPDRPRMEHYQVILPKRFPRLADIEILVPRYQLRRKPWGGLGPPSPKAPEWWSIYSAIKHNRDRDFHLASLKNTLDALAGLYVLTLTLFAVDGLLSNLTEAPVLLRVEDSPCVLLTSGYGLPEITDALK